MKGHAKISQLLISQGAKIGRKGDFSTPILMAAQRGYRDIAQILLDNGADIDGELYTKPLTAAACHGQEEMFNFLVKAGADVSYLKHGECVPLIGAAMKGYETMIHILLIYGVDVKASGAKPVLYAMMEGHVNVVKILVDLGAEKPHPSVIEDYFHKSVQSGYEDQV
jgi:uncharacterized protein